MALHKKAGNGDPSAGRNEADAIAAARRRTPPSVIAADLRIQGNIQAGGVVHVEGQIEGDVACDTLTIGEAGAVKGRIAVDTIKVLGTVRGAILGRLVRLLKSAQVFGDVTHESLEVDAGAVVHGYYKQRDPEKPAVEGKHPIPGVPPRPKRTLLSKSDRKSDLGESEAAAVSAEATSGDSRLASKPETLH